MEAAIYSLEAAGEYLDKFRANASAELTVEVKEIADEEQKKRKQEHSSVELPIDFKREYYTLV